MPRVSGTGPHDDDEPFQHDGPALSADGEVAGPRPAAPPEAPAAAPPACEAPLELAEVPRAPREEYVEPAPYREVAPAAARGRGRALRWVALAAVLLVGGGFLALRLYARTGGGVHPSGPLGELLAEQHGALLIDSQPPGATIRIGRETVGVTPWAGDNRFPAGAKVELTLAGHKPWFGVLRGAPEQTIHASLEKAAR